MTRTPLQIRQHNERIRTIIAVLSNGGLALFGTFTAIIYNGARTDEALGMAIIGLFLISGSCAESIFLLEET